MFFQAWWFAGDSRHNCLVTFRCSKFINDFVWLRQHDERSATSHEWPESLFSSLASRLVDVIAWFLSDELGGNCATIACVAAPASNSWELDSQSIVELLRQQNKIEDFPRLPLRSQVYHLLCRWCRPAVLWRVTSKCHLPTIVVLSI